MRRLRPLVDDPAADRLIVEAILNRLRKYRHDGAHRNANADRLVFAFMLPDADPQLRIDILDLDGPWNHTCVHFLLRKMLHWANRSALQHQIAQRLAAT